MAKVEKVYEYISTSADIPIQKYSLLDTIRVLIQYFSKSSASELDKESEVDVELATMSANLSDFLKKVTAPIREGKHKAVLVRVPNMYDPVLEDVINNNKVLSHNYKVTIFKPDISYDVKFKYKILLQVIED